ncbi:MAG: hypothetical protein IJR13_07760 [Bacteroidales bacterium]|nr:hypothetical protein [Bacteroidales bacterium]
MGWLKNMFAKQQTNAPDEPEKSKKDDSTVQQTMQTASGESSATATQQGQPQVSTDTDDTYPSANKSAIPTSYKEVQGQPSITDIEIDRSIYPQPQGMIQRGSGQHDDTADKDATDISSPHASTRHRDAFKAMYGETEPEKMGNLGYTSWQEFVEDGKRRKTDEAARLRRDHLWNQIGDAISAAANLYWTTQGAPNAYDPTKGMSAKTKERWDKLKAERDKQIDEYRKGALRAAEQDAAADVKAEDQRIARENNRQIRERNASESRARIDNYYSQIETRKKEQELKQKKYEFQQQNAENLQKLKEGRLSIEQARLAIEKAYKEGLIDIRERELLLKQSDEFSTTTKTDEKGRTTTTTTTKSKAGSEGTAAPSGGGASGGGKKSSPTGGGKKKASPTAK